MRQLSNGTIESCVISTIVYSDIFDYPLTAGEIEKKLIVGERSNSSDGVTDSFLRGVAERRLREFVVKGKLENQGKYYFLPGREKIVALRKKREKYAEEKMRIARWSANLIKLIPTVKFVGLTGSVAAGNSKKDDDIDLLIISSVGWLWTTRLLATLVIGLTGRRRRPGEKKVKDKICLNMFIDESNMNCFDRNLFIANEIAQLKPIVDKNNTYQNFLSDNEWIKNFLPNAIKNNKFQVQNVNCTRRSSVIVDKLWERLVMKIQLWWMRRRRTTEITNPHLIAFHPQDISEKVLNKYEKRIRKMSYNT